LASLISFLRTGRLGSLSLGIEARFVQGILGEPNAVSVTRPTIWKYGQLELVLSPDEQVTFIALQLWQTESGFPESLGVEVDLPGGLALDQALVRIAGAGLGAELVPALTHDDQVSFRITSSGVQLHFVDAGLHSIQHHAD
jgi:hypothetical protein